MTGGGHAWWRDAVVYQVYPRSFADGDGDGQGDLRGCTARLGHLRDLGVDAVWLTPWYPSPMADGGYDVSDYRDVHPQLGTLEEADGLLRRAHELGIRVIIDLVANHTSVEHPWFVAALAAPPGAAERDRYFFREGRGPHGDEPPNDWVSAFGGPAWTRLRDADGRPGQWYLHLFDASQPDLDWTNPDVGDEFDDVLRFWFDRGVDGIRVDAAPAMGKAPGLPDAGLSPDAHFDTRSWTDSPLWDRDEVHAVLRRFRRVADAYPGDRAFVAEAVVSSHARTAAYVRPDEMHTAFNFEYLASPWEAASLRRVIDETLRTLQSVGAPATWVLSSHDEVRHLSRYGRPDTSSTPMRPGQEHVDLVLGHRRARAAALLTLALPGSSYLYQGEELGLPEVVDLPGELREDPVFRRRGGTVLGRDGCRVPLPWEGDEPPFGFSPPGTTTWLPQPDAWSELTVERQRADPASMLSLYSRAIALRSALKASRTAPLQWLDTPEPVLGFDVGPHHRCLVNFGDDVVDLSGRGVVLLHSGDADSGSLRRDEAVWLRPGPGP